MQLNQISGNKKQRIAKRIGRGGKRGTYSGKGIKGQKSRAGRKMRPEWRDALKRIPKKRGYKFKSIQETPVILNLAQIDKAFNSGEIVSAEILCKKSLVEKKGGKLPVVKILSDGEISKKLSFKNLKFSESAKEKILKAGGEIK